MTALTLTGTWQEGMEPIISAEMLMITKPIEVKEKMVETSEPSPSVTPQILRLHSAPCENVMLFCWILRI